MHFTGATMRRQAGLTLVECLIAVAIAAVLLGTALPGLHELRVRRQLEAVAAQLETDLQLARSESVARNEGIRFEVAVDTAGSCYLLHTGPSGACGCSGSGAASCKPGADVLRRHHLPADTAVQFQAGTSPMLFDPAVGTVTPTGTVRLTSESGRLHLVVNIMGRIRSCTPGAWLPGLPAC
jgi:type IV fimbrial biogenesis protein FimT